jgi:hypothetical protein
MPGGELHELLDWHLAKLGGTAKGNFSFPVELDG